MLKILRYFIFMFAVALLPDASIAATSCSDAGWHNFCPSGAQLYQVSRNTNGDITGVQLVTDIPSETVYCLEGHEICPSGSGCSIYAVCKNIGDIYTEVLYIAVKGNCHAEPNSPPGPMGACVADHCVGYNTCPAGVGGSGKKCKAVSGCSINGCQKYEICDTSDGAITYEIYGLCHFEGSTCYANERDCKDFPVAGGAITNYTPSDTAYWMGSEIGWDVSGCKYNINDADFPSFYCKKFNGRSMVTSENRYVSSVTSAVTYTWTHSYCQKCYAGHLPDIIPSPTNGVVARPDSTGNWGVFVCTTSVTAPHYAEGCVIDFSAASGDTVLAACKKSCSVPGYTIIQDGATSESQCTIDSSQIYSDNTGRFTIGAGQCSP